MPRTTLSPAARLLRQFQPPTRIGKRVRQLHGTLEFRRKLALRITVRAGSPYAAQHKAFWYAIEILHDAADLTTINTSRELCHSSFPDHSGPGACPRWFPQAYNIPYACNSTVIPIQEFQLGASCTDFQFPIGWMNCSI